MKKTLNNNNGITYNVLACTETEGGNVYLLTHATEGGHVLKYVVARNWSEKYKCWDCGQYFMVYDNNLEEVLTNAQDVYLQTVSALLYAAF